jgi:hypothetical protein
MSEHAKLIESAIASYLIGTSFPDSLKNDAGLFRIFEGESESDKDGQVIIVSCGSDLTEDPPFSANYWADCSVELRTPISSPVDGDTEYNSLTIHQAASTVLRAAIMDTGFVAGINNAGNIFVYMVLNRNPSRNEQQNYHSSGYSFRLYSCQTN